MNMLHQRKNIQQLKQQLKESQSYAEWQKIALKLDQLTEQQAWKSDNSSPYFDAKLISHRLQLLQRYRLQRRIRNLIPVVFEGLSYDIANIGHPMLFTHTFVGTKTIIETYVQEMSASLEAIAHYQGDDFTHQEKLEFFRQCQQAYGQPALMLSGGSTLGLFHTGVCKALIDHDLLPNVISGSSAGAITTAALGTRSLDEFQAMITGEYLFTQALRLRKVKELLQGGGIADVQYLKHFLVDLLGDVTFAEAYQRSGLDINIAVAPYDPTQNSRVLNAKTAPDVLVWSAVLASCAVPMIYPPVRLTSKRYDGEYTPYMADTKWVDGSMRHDFPREKIARLYNINYTIASQVNPHIVPFLQSDRQRYAKDVLSWTERVIRRQGKGMALSMMDFARERTTRLPVLQRMLEHGYGIFDQHYYGDVNIIARYELQHYRYLLQNPTDQLLIKLQKEGERATWSKISAIECHARIEKTIRHALEFLQKSAP
ncbi:MAG: DUF3336 domain-containing protein [Acinetobacter sp.]|nr:DUF3336 domain-containing protein [Acinetobacter sp.]